MTKTIESYINGPLLNDPQSMKLRYQSMMYNIPANVVELVESMLQSEKTVVLFSGSWRFKCNATYIELKMMRHCGLDFHPLTLFVDDSSCPLLDLTLRSIKPKNIAVLHSDYWIAHQPLEQLLSNLDQLLQYVQPGGQIICTVPLRHLNFNRLTTTYDDLGFTIIDYHARNNTGTALIVRKQHVC